MDEELKQRILSLCDKADEVLQNNDWPTDDGLWLETTTGCSCPLADLILEIREGLSGA
jgi:hypothetical protein